MRTESFEQEALAHLDALTHFAFQLCRDQQKTGDLVQETMLKAFNNSASYRPGTNCRAWLFQICKNSFINDYHRRQYMPVAVDYQESAGRSMGDDESGSGRGITTVPVDDQDRRNREHLLGDEVMQALQRIPRDYQTALILSDIEGFTYKEIAAFARTPIGTIRARIHRGRKMLAAMLGDYARDHGYATAAFSN